MRYITLFIFAITCTYTQAQTYLELSIPMGTSYVTKASIDRINEELQANDVQWSSGFYRGLEAGFSFQLNEKLALRAYGNYLILQNNLRNIEERESFSWVYRETQARMNEHNIGMGAYFQYNAWEKGRHSISPFLRAGLNLITYYNAYTSETRRNYYPPVEQNFEGRIAENVDYTDYYVHLSLGLTYKLLIYDSLYLFSDVGFSHFYNVDEDYKRSEVSIDWNSIYASIGAGWNLISKG